MRLGELLLEAGEITREQLDTALRAQQSHGGRIGTNLIELGYISENTLGAMLSKQLGVPTINTAAIDKIPKSVIALLPADKAKHFRACPVRIDGSGKLFMLMSDPTDQSSITELSKFTRYPIRPMVAAESVVNYALEKHYLVLGKPSHEVVLTQKTTAMDLVPSADFVRTGGTGKHPLPKIATPTGKSANVYNPYPATMPIGDTASGRITVPELANYLLGAPNQSDLFNVMLRFIGQDFARVATVALRNGNFVGWKSHGNDINEQALRSVNVPMNDLPLLSKALNEGQPRIGRGSPTILGGLSAVLGPPGERAILTMPILCAGQAIGCFAAVGGRDGVQKKVEEYVTAAAKFDIALQIMALKKQLLE